MIVKMIYEHAKLHVDGDFPWVHAKRWVNEAMRLVATMCDTGSITDSIQLEVEEENKWHDIHNGTLRITSILKDGVKYNNYLEDINKVFLKETGLYDITFKRLPNYIELESDIPEIHEAYHFPLSYWIASREQYRFNPDNADGQRLEATFYLEINEIDTTLKKSHRVRKIKV